MSYTKLLYHVVFRTLQSVPAIEIEYEKELYSYIWSFCQQQKCTLHRINGMPDHLHLLVEIHQSMAVADFVKQLKNASHKWLEKHQDLFPDFYAWSKGYCALSYSEHEKEKIVNYIKNQKEHHQNVGFVDEMKAILFEAGIEINQYLDDDL
ncbi:IS200/IS605 family transposase [Actinobacillus vicugnae]|uniref:IS200/IS605 family transposase n=1 Tax=Actinobacillus vicugnae TaxID=2573093 RepID=UPI0012412DAE|nr:IS200/IS605 family transposase [Actinobacillus vicugnae]